MTFKKLGVVFTCVAAPITLSGCDQFNAGRNTFDFQIGAEEQTILNTEIPQSRALTANEREMLTNIFRSELNTTNIRIQYYQSTHSQFASNVLPDDPHNIRIYGGRHYSPDYSQDENAFRYGLFVYEATRLAQNQNPRWRYSSEAGDEYTLYNSAPPFQQYGPFEQAAMMEDYARRFLHFSRSGRQLTETYGEENCRADSALYRTVERQFPHLTEQRWAPQHVTTRELTQNERRFAEGIFGTAVDLEPVRIHLQNRDCSVWKATVDSPRDIHFWGRNDFSGDYAAETYNDHFGAYIHEITHIWQRQSNYQHTNRLFVNEPDPYEYPIDITKWRFEDYGVEQQASIIEDYSRIFLHSEHHARRYRNTEQREQLRMLVENRFPAARQTRLHYEQNGALPGQTRPQNNVRINFDFSGLFPGA